MVGCRAKPLFLTAILGISNPLPGSRFRALARAKPLGTPWLSKSAPNNCRLSAIGEMITPQNTPDGASRLLTRKELSGRWQLSTETLKRRERCGLLPCLKLGRGVRYRLADVESLEVDAEVHQGGRSPKSAARKGTNLMKRFDRGESILDECDTSAGFVRVPV